MNPIPPLTPQAADIFSVLHFLTNLWIPPPPPAPLTQAEDFDEGVQYQLIQKRSEEEAVAALR